jgi:hypothetical protein
MGRIQRKICKENAKEIKSERSISKNVIIKLWANDLMVLEKKAI